MNIIEITGAPCSGKSYYINNVLKGDYSSLPIYGNHLSKKIHFETAQKISLFFLGVMCSILSIDLIKFVLKNNNLTSFSDKMKMLFFTFLKIGRFHFLNALFSDKTIVIDEGVSHLPFNLMLTEENDIKTMLSFFPKSFYFVEVWLFKEKEHVLLWRLRNRGHKKVLKDSDMIPFVKNNLKISSVVKVHYENSFCHYKEIVSYEE
ncbi:hypothetical protein [Vibrio harveyi]|uniref:hypothetical protein n=1 Tax=Vibrio harveyi TaxID=669 RepID=UPI003AAE27D5